MPKLLLVTDSQAVFLEQAFILWKQIHEGDHFEETEGFRADLAEVRRKLAGKYTKGERQEIAALALKMMG